LNADFHIKEEVVVRYNFFEGLQPSGRIQKATGINWCEAIYRPWRKQGGVEHQLKFGKFFISRAHYLWDVVGILLGRPGQPARAPFLKAPGGDQKGRRPTPGICVK
jgi:hypothetical protein